MFLSCYAFVTIVVLICVRTLKNPYVGVAAYYFFTLAKPMDIYHWILERGWFFNNMVLIMATITMFSYFVNLNKIQKYYSLIKVHNYLIFLFWVGFVISYIFARVQWYLAWYTTVATSKMTLFYYFGFNLTNSKKKLNLLYWVMMVAFGWLAVWATGRYYIDGIWEVKGPGLSGASYFDRNKFAMAIVMAMPFIYYYAFMTKKMALKVLCWIMVVVMMNVVMLTLSRGAWLGMVGVLGLCFITNKKKGLSLLLAGILIPVFIALMGPGVTRRISSIFLPGEERDASAKSRIVSWQAGIRMFLDNPIVGVGPQNYHLFSSEYGRGAIPPLVAHNTYIQMLADLGLVGGVPYILLIFVCFFSVVRLWRICHYIKDDWAYYYTLAMMGSLLAYMITGVFISLHLFEPFFYLVLLISCFRNYIYNTYGM